MTFHNADIIAACRSAAQVLVDQLVIQDVGHVFCVPGESLLPVLDALKDSGIALTVCRSEAGAAMMAEAAAKASGRPGICFVARGGGAANAMAGIHVAQQDSTPLILFVAQGERRNRDRDGFQEMDCPAVFASQTKWTAEIGEPSRMAEYVGRAFSTAMAGRPGPVVLALPRDVLSEDVMSRDAPHVAALETSPGAHEIAALEDLIDCADRPLLVLGGSRWDEASCLAVARFSERFDMPVMTGYRRAPLFDPLHPNYAGDLGLSPNPKLVARVKAADLIIVAGGRLNEITAQGYTLFDIPTTRVKLVHAYPGAEEIGRVWQPDLAIHASPQRFAAALDGLTPLRWPRWAATPKAAHEDYLAWSSQPTPQPGAVNPGTIMVWLRDNLPDDAILCNGAGNYAAWLHRFYRFRKVGTHIAPVSASMGYGMPAAVAMQRLHPGRTVVSVNGGDDFLVHAEEFATAVQYRLPIIALAFDNASFGAVRMQQEREFPGRVTGTDLTNPDFAAYARAFGGFGATVETTEDFAAAFRAAEASGLPAILHVKYDIDAIAPATTLSAIRSRALHG